VPPDQGEDLVVPGDEPLQRGPLIVVASLDCDTEDCDLRRGVDPGLAAD
jgi:hypothetical protein